MNEKNTTPKVEKPKTSDGRIRNIALMLYKDSCNPDWQTILEDEHIPSMWIYHDRDKNPNGEDKKPHWHVILCFEGKKSPTQLQAYADSLGAANGVYQEVNSVRGYARYLCHMDNPEKAQYDSGEVHTVAIDYQSVVGMASDKYKAVGEMIDFCEENHILSYSELLLYARVHRYDWFKSLCDNSTIVIKEFLVSKAWTEEQNLKRIQVDPATGAIVSE